MTMPIGFVSSTAKEPSSLDAVAGPSKLNLYRSLDKPEEITTPGPARHLSFLSRRNRWVKPYSSMVPKALTEQYHLSSKLLKDDIEMKRKEHKTLMNFRRSLEHKARMEVYAAQKEFFKTLTNVQNV